MCYAQAYIDKYTYLNIHAGIRSWGCATRLGFSGHENRFSHKYVRSISLYVQSNCYDNTCICTRSRPPICVTHFANDTCIICLPHGNGARLHGNRASLVLSQSSLAPDVWSLAVLATLLIRQTDNITPIRSNLENSRALSLTLKLLFLELVRIDFAAP